jgi:hypothetical protein
MDKPTLIELPDISKLSKMCQEYIDQLEEEEYVGDDFREYIFECALETFFGKEVWAFVNKF